VDGWEQYLSQEPFGDECMYLAVLCAWFFNANFASEETKPIKPQDVIDEVEALKHRNDPQRPGPKSDFNHFRSWALSRIAITE